jgi:hypothetical protein
MARSTKFETEIYATDPDGREVAFLAVAHISPARAGTYDDPPEGGEVEDLEIFNVDAKGKALGASLTDEEAIALGFDMEKVADKVWNAYCDQGDTSADYEPDYAEDR